MITFYLMSGIFIISFFFEIEFFIVEFILFYNKKKYLKNFYKMLITLIIYVLIILFIPPFLSNTGNLFINILFEAFILLVYVVSSTLIFYVGTDFKLTKLIFYAGVAYAIQHLIYSVSSLFSLAVNNGPSFIDNTLHYVLEIPTILILILISLYIRQKLKLISDVEIDKKSLSALVLIIILVNTILGSLCNKTLSFPSLSKDEYLYIKSIIFLIEKIYSLICCALILFIQLSLARMKDLENRIRIGELLTHIDKENYEFRKKSLEESRIIFHDLKHIMNDLEGKVGSDVLYDYKKRIELLSSYQKTGNFALDVVLNEEVKKAKENDIHLSYIGNGKLISFMNEADIYALFLNIIDNAIEALLNIESKDKKTINLTIRNKQHLVYATCENYFENKLVKDNNRFLTTKSDKFYHGYGMQSIEKVVKKYNGNVVFSNDKEIFKVSILFAAQKNEREL